MLRRCRRRSLRPRCWVYSAAHSRPARSSGCTAQAACSAISFRHAWCSSAIAMPLSLAPRGERRRRQSRLSRPEPADRSSRRLPRRVPNPQPLRRPLKLRRFQRRAPRPARWRWLHRLRHLRQAQRWPIAHRGAHRPPPAQAQPRHHLPRPPRRCSQRPPSLRPPRLPARSRRCRAWVSARCSA